MRYLEKGKKLREKSYTLSSLDELRDYFGHETDDWKSVWVYDTGLSFYTKPGWGYCHINMDESLPYMIVETDNVRMQIYDRDIHRIYVERGTLDIYLKGGDTSIVLGR